MHKTRVIILIYETMQIIRKGKNQFKRARNFSKTTNNNKLHANVQFQ